MVGIVGRRPVDLAPQPPADYRPYGDRRPYAAETFADRRVPSRQPADCL